MWVLYLDTPREKSKVNGAAVGQYSAWLAFFHWLAFLCNELQFGGCYHVVCSKTKVFLHGWDTQEIQLGQGTAQAQPHVSVWQLVLSLTQFWPTTASTVPDNECPSTESSTYHRLFTHFGYDQMLREGSDTHMWARLGHPTTAPETHPWPGVILKGSPDKWGLRVSGATTHTHKHTNSV